MLKTEMVQEQHGGGCLENPRDGGTSWAAVYGVAWGPLAFLPVTLSASKSFYQVIAWERKY